MLPKRKDTAAPDSLEEVKSMTFKGMMKRVLPFAAAVLVGLLVTSIFMPIAPNFERHGNERRAAKWEHRKKIRHENFRLNVENEHLRAENERLRSLLGEGSYEMLATEAPAPPPIKRIRVERYER